MASDQALIKIINVGGGVKGWGNVRRKPGEERQSWGMGTNGKIGGRDLFCYGSPLIFFNNNNK